MVPLLCTCVKPPQEGEDQAGMLDEAARLHRERAEEAELFLHGLQNGNTGLY